MVLQVFSVLDSKSGAFGVPFFAFNGPVAQRLVAATVNGGDSLMAKYPQDYQLFHIGSFDDARGVIEPIVPVVVCTVVSLKEVVHAS